MIPNAAKAQVANRYAHSFRIQALPIDFPTITQSSPPQSSVNRSSRCILRTITTSPTVTIANNANPNQPNTIAVTPTPLATLPFAKSCVICDAETAATCCHNTVMSTNTEEMKMRASAICVTGREGNGFTSTSLPVRASRSSCQPGNVARRRKVMKARTRAAML